MYIKLLCVFANVLLVTGDCGKDVCVSDFIKDFFNNEETAVFKNQNESIVEEEIKIVDLDTILKEIADLLEMKTNDTELVKNYENKTYVFVKAFNFHHNDDHNGSVVIDDIKVKPVTENDKYDVQMKHLVLNTSSDKTLKEISDKNFEEILTKAVEQDNEIFDDDLETLYNDFSDDNSTDYPDIDYIEIYKDTTVEEYLYVPTESTVSVNELNFDISNQNKNIETLVEYSLDSVEEYGNKTKLNTSSKNEVQPFIPWITTIFVVNQTNNYQFDYLCDGILVAENTILTGARCVHRKQTVIDPEDLLIVLGKTSLQTAAEYEKITKIKHVVIHENFTNDNGKVENDLALLVIEEPIAENNAIKVANISDVEDFDVESDEAATTAWSLSGEITPIYFEDDENNLCANINKVENTICTTYGNDVPLCPSYGGIYAAKIDQQWYLQGVFYGDPADRGFCFHKNVIYTSIKNYLTWILDTITSY